MHVLLTNDDGPLDDRACPYMKYLVDEINTNTNWDLSIVVPNQQRSWIGKAHFAGKTLTTSYIYTQESTSGSSADGVNKFDGPFNTPQHRGPEWQEWCLVDSTPAACADIGIHHLYSQTKEKEIDLVLSGPNFGKNAGNLYVLTSGTVGAAMEAVTHGKKAIALSYSFNSPHHDHQVLKEAAHISVKLVTKLYNQLKELKDIDIFSVNVPLVKSLKLGQTKIRYAPILENYWKSIYAPSEELNEHGQMQFHWAPDFKVVHKNGLVDFKHTDSRVLLEEEISVTPLKAAFKFVEPLGGEIVLDADEPTTESPTIDYFLITVPKDSYIYEPWVEAAKKSGRFQITSDKRVLAELKENSKIRVFHYGEYEDLDLDLIGEYPNQYFIPSYIYRKALIRKHFLANTIHHYTVKNPDSVLISAAPESYQLEVDYAEFLDDSLDEAYELRDEINSGTKTWILKPSMSDKGQGIRIFKTVEQLQAIFDSFEEEDSDAEDEDDEGDDNNGVIVSQLRHFIVQEYRSNPLLLPAYDNKKFHLRTYVVASGDLKVYVYKNILTLFAGSAYVEPEDKDGEIDMAGHLTNTCLQEEDSPLVVPWWDLKDDKLTEDQKQRVFEQVCSITGETFKAASSVDKINFQPMDNAIELFGIDYLVNDDLSVTLLEVNSYPDFKQTGDELKGLIYRLFDEVVDQIVAPLVQGTESSNSSSNLVPVLGAN
ncbi:TTL-domain-containing protein [Suhomyces tanzawaensis NRRL Y-17324]|uniref:TTL-domain-containing protein n=1 Tax=Suhomyces tanzawaensis NRRL Y-17324 TaxID=984487 RepID=A0A1E4SQD3_9ASCO|nr:TTL-domain-containing protein [Suhomyces tanzawaensis NRRL Y-17324]ODV81705.1 TTL-domain-containing protein [Suhomyces tanzawaensis NRRL Y-17324]